MHRREAILCLAMVAVGGSRHGASAAPGDLVSLIDSKIDGAASAGCDAIRRLDQRLQAEAARSATMPAAETDAEVRAIGAALAGRQAAAQKVNAALQAARIDLARQAIYAALDTVLAACIAQQAPQCIATVYGVKIVGGAADASVQALQAKDGADLTEILIGYAKTRGTTLLKDLPGDVKPKAVHEAGKRALKLVAVANMKLAKAGAKVVDARQELEGALAALDQLDRAYAGTLINEQSYRAFRKQHYEAQRWLPQLLLTTYGGTGCAAPNIDVKPIP